MGIEDSQLKPRRDAMKTKLMCTLTTMAVFVLPAAEALAAGRNWI
jgi:hypothetical protein